MAQHRYLTKYLVKKIKFDWIIQCVSFCPIDNGEFIESPVIRVGDGCDEVFTIRLYPRGSDQFSKDYVSIYLASYSSKKAALKFSLSFLDSNEKTLHTLSSEVKVIPPRCDWGFDKAFSRHYLLENDRGFIWNDSLHIVFYGEVSTSCTESFKDFKERSRANDNSLMKDFGNLLCDSVMSDVKIYAGEMEYDVHKLILVARSPVFAAMFRHDTEESRTHTIAINDVEPQVMEDVLHYMYTNEIEGLEERPAEILEFADRYQLLGLKSQCAEGLIDSLTTESAATLVVLADRHDLPCLKEVVIEFIFSTNYEVLRTKSWRDLTAAYPRLVNEVNASVVEKLSDMYRPPSERPFSTLDHQIPTYRDHRRRPNVVYPPQRIASCPAHQNLEYPEDCDVYEDAVLSESRATLHYFPNRSVSDAPKNMIKKR